MYDALVFNIHLNTLLYSSSVTVIIFSMELKVITIIHSFDSYFWGPAVCMHCNSGEQNGACALFELKC